MPRTPAQWLKEIKLAVTDAADAEPFGRAIGELIAEANLFHLAPLVSLKFRGKKLGGREADRVIKVALANYIANSDSEGVDHGLPLSSGEPEKDPSTPQRRARQRDSVNLSCRGWAACDIFLVLGPASLAGRIWFA